MKLLDHMQWRYATKKYDPSKKVPQDKLDQILEAIRMAPTSSGLQPFEVFVISDAATRQKLLPASYNQQQIVESSHLLVFASWDDITAERITKVFDLVAAERGGMSDAVAQYRDMLIASFPPRGAAFNAASSARQAYIALGFALAAAAELKVDSTPMEGFDPKAYDEILGLSKRGLKTAVIMALGYRGEGDWLAPLKKVRVPKTKLFHFI